MTTDFHDPGFQQRTQERRDTLTKLLTEMQDLWKDVDAARELQAGLNEVAPSESGPSSTVEASLSNVRNYLDRVRFKRAARDYEVMFQIPNSGSTNEL